MDFTRLLAIVGDEPVFETGLLLAGDVDPDRIRRQLSRWVAAEPHLTGQNWREVLPDRLSRLKWQPVSEDVRPLLEPGAGPELPTLENFERSLARGP